MLSLKNVTKIYGAVTAMDHVSLDVRPGEVHALVGENGAGKSTLIKCITGAVTPDAGSFVFEGAEYACFTPMLSKKLGIAAIYQEFVLSETMSVAENIFMGQRLNKGPVVNFRLMEAKAKEILDIFGVDIRPKDIVRNLSVACRQLVEIAKAIAKNAKLLIMDEPTAPLTDHEVELLFSIIKDLKKQGVTIVYISHRLDELYRVADRVTVMRDGRIITTHEIGEVQKPDLIRYMVGRELNETFQPRRVGYGDTLLEVENLSGSGVGPISFRIRRGEIVGLGGLVGSGRTEIARLIFGADPKSGGRVTINGKELARINPRVAVDNGIGFVTEDRKKQGLLLNLSIRQNITLPIVRQISRLLVVNQKKDLEYCVKYGGAMRIKTPGYDLAVGSLSGGNQQKVVLSKWLASDCKVLILDEPTRGIDVGAKQDIYQLINTLAEQGIAILIISSEMEELLGLTDRMHVMYEGKYMGSLEKEEYSQERVLRLASGEPSM